MACEVGRLAHMQRFCGPHPAPLRPHQPFRLPCRCKLSIAPSPDPTLASHSGEFSIIEHIQQANCRIVFWFVSAVGLGTGSGWAGPGFSVTGPGQAGPLFFCSITGWAGPNLFRAGPGLIFLARARGSPCYKYRCQWQTFQYLTSAGELLWCNMILFVPVRSWLHDRQILREKWVTICLTWTLLQNSMHATISEKSSESWCLLYSVYLSALQYCLFYINKLLMFTLDSKSS